MAVNRVGEPNEKEKTNDRVSELPEILIHKILSFLSAKKAARTSVLSKTWQSAYSTRSVLILKETYFGEQHYKRMDYAYLALEERKTKFLRLTDKERREKFLRFADNALERYKTEQIRIQSFKFWVSIDDCTGLSFVDKIIGQAINNGVENLSLSFRLHYFPSYSFPQAIFAAKSSVKFKLELLFTGFDMSYDVNKWIEQIIENGFQILHLDIRSGGCFLSAKVFAANSLSMLKIMNCNFKPNSFEDTIKSHSLRYLRLANVKLNEMVLKNIISVCPLVEEFSIINCKGFNNFKVCGLRNLKILSVCLWNHQTIDFHAPNLQSLTYQVNSGWLVPHSLDMCAPSLKYLHLERMHFRDDFLQNLISTCPLLEELHVHRCQKVKNINLLNHSLKKIFINHQFRLGDVKIESSNLTSFELRTADVPSLSFTSADIGNWKSLIEFTYCDDLSLSWFLMLREFLSKFRAPEVELGIYARGNLCDIADLMGPETSSRPEVEKLKLSWLSTSREYEKFLDGLFWICRPSTLILHPRTYMDIGFAEFVYRKILERNNPTSHWQHDLKDAEIQYFKEATDEWLPIRWITSAVHEILTNDGAVRFILKW